MEENEIIRTFHGVGVIVKNRDGMILMGKRCNTIGEGSYSPPGGNIEDGESEKRTGERETMEEAGIRVFGLRKFGTFIDEAYGCRFITEAYLALGYLGKPRLTEDGKHSEWGWYSLDNLPKPIFVPGNSILEVYSDIVEHVRGSRK